MHTYIITCIHRTVTEIKAYVNSTRKNIMCTFIFTIHTLCKVLQQGHKAELVELSSPIAEVSGVSLERLLRLWRSGNH